MISAAARESQFKARPCHSVLSVHGLDATVCTCTKNLHMFLTAKTCAMICLYTDNLRSLTLNVHRQLSLQLSTVCAVFKADRKWGVWRTGWRGRWPGARLWFMSVLTYSAFRPKSSGKEMKPVDILQVDFIIVQQRAGLNSHVWNTVCASVNAAVTRSNRKFCMSPYVQISIIGKQKLHFQRLLGPFCSSETWFCADLAISWRCGQHLELCNTFNESQTLLFTCSHSVRSAFAFNKPYNSSITILKTNDTEKHQIFPLNNLTPANFWMTNWYADVLLMDSHVQDGATSCPCAVFAH